MRSILLEDRGFFVDVGCFSVCLLLPASLPAYLPPTLPGCHQTQRDAFMTTLAKLTMLHSPPDIKQKNVDAIKVQRCVHCTPCDNAWLDLASRQAKREACGR